MQAVEEQSNSPIYGVEAWVEYLKERPLPVRNSVLRRLQKQLQDPNVPLRSLNRTIQSDPVLSLHVVRKASELHDKFDSKVKSIDHAINSLGLDNIQAVLKEATPLRLNPSSVAQKMYFRYISVSHHAAVQATDWLQKRKAPFIDETYLATLFYGVGHWLLWQHAALHMSEIQSKIREQQTDVVLAENDVLGCTVQEISQRLIADWGISELAVVSLEHETSPNKKTLSQLHQRALGDPRLSDQDLREINHLVQEKFFPVKLANWIALTANLGWQQTKTMKIIDIINDFLKGEISETIAMLHVNCASASRSFHVAGTLAPAAEMLMLPSELMINFKLSEKERAQLQDKHPAVEKPVQIIAPVIEPEEADETPPAEIKPDYLDQALFDQISERFLKGYNLYTRPKHVLQGLIQGLNRGLGFERVCMYLINGKSHRMKTAFSAGFEETHPIIQFEYDLEIPSLFKKLRERPGCIWVKPANQEQMQHMLPEIYQNWCCENGYLLMSLFLGKTPIAIIHADYGSHGSEISEFHHERFRYLCSAASLGLKKLTKP
ncbi:HDOD domain-containing protein [Neptuniibacter halophilus]|uniref:HDOD domain-containing protein n=1 Tax=Neptuniibacter halophilus TaxID=651666 RepID=UPI002572B9CB|nr:HDOD domain-containing protein [Neptuniibacter halophilus]